jgi:hypothetical protein
MSGLVAEFTAADRELYNALPDVQFASERLRQAVGFPEFLRDFGGLASNYNLCHRIGVVLLHRHFTLMPERIMMESPLVGSDGRLELVTRAMSTSEIGEALPVRWAISVGEGIWRPLEYSLDKTAVRATTALLDREDVVNDYARLLDVYSFQDYLGLCITERSISENDEDEVLVEKTSEVASIVRLEARAGVDFTRVLTTVWSPCGDQHCLPTSYCEWYCWAAGNDHGRGHRSRSGPHESF